MKKKTHEYSSTALKQEIIKNARSLGLAENWAATIAEQTVKTVDAWVASRSIVTENDIRRVAYKKLKELNADVAYIYQNHGKIL